MRQPCRSIKNLAFTLLFAAPLLPASDSLPSQALSVLNKRCVQCHGDTSAMSGLKLTARDAILKGGSRGAALKPGSPNESLLLQVVLHNGKLAMPPGPKLPDEEIATLRTWIEKGAEWPDHVVQTARPKWWAFEAPHRPNVPAIGATDGPIDLFLSRKLQAAKVQPAGVADRLALLRRATFDLLGLPPSAEQVRAWEADKSPDALEHTIDSLLASPRYGEKWGRHWLDLVRYGDTAGFEQDPYTLEAWRYRDSVNNYFNDDKPYDRFVKEQIAADELFPDDSEARTGTGYYRVGTNRDMLFKVEDLNAFEKLTDYTDTTSAVFLGLTVGCARCHDHKFDPIPQRDYYRMQAIFAPAVNDRVFLEYNTARFSDIAANGREFKLRQIGAEIDRIEKPYKKRLRDEKIAKLEPALEEAVKAKAEARTPAQQALATQAEEKLKGSDDDVRATLSQADAERIHAIEKRLLAMFSGYGPPPMAPGIIDIGREAPRTYIAQRGNYEAPGEEVQPGFLTALGGGDVPEPPLHAKSTGRRKALATWIASADNPLFARVMVNRIWQNHFGSGLVKTGNDFGIRAGPPSHPELLDWLATEFVARKWSVKSMHKLIMMSEAYRRSSNATESAQKIDPANALFSHMNRRRLQAEEVRDSVLQVTGNLNLAMGGSPVVPPLEPEELFGIIGKPENAWVVTPDSKEHTRRSIYMLVRRTFQQPLFEAFDTPDGVQPCPRRNESTTAPQSLALLNSRFMVEQARALGSKSESVDEAWERVLNRKPTQSERDAAVQFIARQTSLTGSKAASMAELARGLLNSNEFLYVD